MRSIVPTVRPRGGASVVCPQCGAASTVVYTRRKAALHSGDEEYVYRLRVCEAGHKFSTDERPRAAKEA